MSLAHQIINEAMEMIAEHGWTIVKQNSSVFKWFKNGCKIEIKLTSDPKDGRPKIIAFIPPDVFGAEQQVETYKLKLKKLNAA